MTPSDAASRSDRIRGALLGLGAAALFGLSAPISKLLLGGLSPVLLAGLLYLGAAVGLWTHHLVRPRTKEAGIGRSDLPLLTAIIVFGGVVGPILMLLGLGRVTAFTGSLLLNLEAPLTVVLAVAVFGEHLERRAAVAIVCILGGALTLRLETGALGGDLAGIVLIAGACLSWALDNNLTQRLSMRDPHAIVRAKTLVAGAVNTTLGLLFQRSPNPSLTLVAVALVVGALSYGLSIVLDTYALRLVGAAREAAYFATAPFVGGLFAIALFGDPIRRHELLAMAAMFVGVVFLLRSRHGHRHVHEAMDHNHLHEHDEHHQHEHHADDPRGEPHAHAHRHLPLVHDHDHFPDAHHRHTH